MYQKLHLKIKCMYASRGCTNVAGNKNFLSHHEECGFAPAQCSHDGCEVTVNRKDLARHLQSCEFRSVTCEECREAMNQRDYEEHVCVLRKKLAEMTNIVQAVQGNQVSTIPDVIFFAFYMANCSVVSKIIWIGQYSAWFLVSVLSSSSHLTVPFI